MSVRNPPSFGPVELTGGRRGTARAPAQPGKLGSVARAVFRKNALPSSLVVVVGAGGVGGTAPTMPGGSGGNTIFHTLVAPGGAGGSQAGEAVDGSASTPGGNGEPGYVVVWEWA